MPILFDVIFLEIFQSYDTGFRYSVVSVIWRMRGMPEITAERGLTFKDIFHVNPRVQRHRY
jgi:DNA-binding phage protein